jgi:hypothetical protein
MPSEWCTDEARPVALSGKRRTRVTRHCVAIVREAIPVMRMLRPSEPNAHGSPTTLLAAWHRARAPIPRNAAAKARDTLQILTSEGVR